MELLRLGGSRGVESRPTRCEGKVILELHRLGGSREAASRHTHCKGKADMGIDSVGQVAGRLLAAPPLQGQG